MKAQHITIVGLGLIGGSLGLAFRDIPGVVLTGVDSNPHTLTSAVEGGVVHSSTDDLVQGIQNADVIFLCTPVLQILPLVKKMLPHLKTGTILTDVGSTKGYLAAGLLALLPPDIHYVSGHPMAGGEKSGILATHKELFKDKWYILVPEASTSLEAVESIGSILTYTGAILTTMDVADHDQYGAIISHVPHVAAAALVNLLDQYPDLEEKFKLVGGGFRDTTRIASSDADMWSDICMTNGEQITDSLLHLKAILDTVILAIQKGDRPAIHHFFKRAKIRRDALITKTDSHTIL